MSATTGRERNHASPAPTCGRIYVDGVFDLFHAGHVAFLEKARALGGPGATLIVGVITDEDASWKRPPVIAHANRVAVVSACRAVDLVVSNPPLVVDGKFLDDHQIDLVVHGDDDRQERFFKAAIDRGVMRYVPYTAGISTSEIIEKVERRTADEFAAWLQTRGAAHPGKK